MSWHTSLNITCRTGNMALTYPFVCDFLVCRPYTFAQLISIYTIILLNLSIGVRKLQVAILARSSWEMSLTVRIV